MSLLRQRQHQALGVATKLGQVPATCQALHAVTKSLAFRIITLLVKCVKLVETPN